MTRAMRRLSEAEAVPDDDNGGQSKPLDESDAAHTPTDLKTGDGSGEGPAAKKRRLASNARGVANLTPEQLAKKRANDREAQRAIRERTKNQIQSLERRIEELTSLQPYQELQALVEAKETVERENLEIRQRLASIAGMLRPLIGQLPDSTTISTELQPLPAATQPPTEASRHSLSPAAGQSRNAYANNDASKVGQTDNNGATRRMSGIDQQRDQGRPGLDSGSDRLGLGFLLDAEQQVSRTQGPSHRALDTSQHRSMAPKNELGGGSSTYSGSPGPSQSRSWVAESSNISNTNYQTAFPSGLPFSGPHSSTFASIAYNDSNEGDEAIDLNCGSGPIPRYTAPVRSTPPTCGLDSLLLDFLHERRQRSAEGRPIHEVIGPRYPSVLSLVNPSRSVYSHPTSRVFTDMLAKFPEMSGLPERVAMLYIMFLLMRWQVSPTRDNYDRLPAWMRPSRAQLLHPHPAWIDHLPFPRMREALVRAQRSPDTAAACLFDKLSGPYTRTLTLSWPYHDTDTLLQSPYSEELLINPVFERHLRNLDNWRLGEAFARAFPGLADVANIPPAELAAARTGSAQSGAHYPSM